MPLAPTIELPNAVALSANPFCDLAINALSSQSSSLLCLLIEHNRTHAAMR
jgi:hypothetical protein